MKFNFIFLFVFSLVSVQLHAEKSTALNLTADLTVFNADCGDANNGAITSITSGGVPPYSFLWSNGETTAGIVDLAPGDYTLTVTDNALNSVVVTGTVEQENSDIQLQLNASYETCEGSCDGNVSVNASGGTGNFTYLWNTGDDFVVVYDACAGLYSVTVTDDAGCTATGSIELELSPEGIWLMSTSTDATCESSNDGTAYVSVMTGVPPFDIIWSDGQTGTNISGLSPGDYYVTVTDVNGCSNIDSVSIESGLGNIELQLNASYETCEGSCDGNVSVNASGGVEPYTYLWNTGDDFVVVDNACAGIYTVTVTDANGCFATDSIALELSPEGVWLMSTSTDATCNGFSDGTAHVSVMAGTPPFDIVWSTIPPQTGEDATGLAAGIYTVTATDANGCFNTDTVTINEPPAIIISIDEVGDADCNTNNGFINISVSGGIPGYTFEWSNGSTTQNIENLETGIYSVTVTDSTGCTAVNSNIEVLTEGISVTSTVTEPTCNGGNDGAASVTVSGGTSPYDINWGTPSGSGTDLSAGTYSVTVTDAVGCSSISSVTITEPLAISISIIAIVNAECDIDNGMIDVTVENGTPAYTYEWSNNSNTQDIENLAPGTYSLTVTDVNSCTAVIDDIIVGEEECCESPVISGVIVVEATCGNSNGEACIEVLGNNEDFTYNWDTTEGTEIAPGNCRTGLPAGIYSVTVTGDPDCPTVVETFTIGNVDFPPVVVVSITPATCGSEDGTVIMSEPNFEYLWCNGETVYNPMNLPAGFCAVQITDPATGCVDFQTVFIEEINPLDLEITVNNQPDCGIANGSISVQVTGGSGDYTYNWNNGSTGATIDGIPSGNYCVTITDNISTCMIDTCFVLTDTVPGAVIVITDPGTVSCNGSNDATVIYDITYDSLFAQPAIIEIINENGDTVTNGSLSAGNYCIVVTDANGCIAGTSCFEINEPALIDMDIAIDDSCPSPSINIVSISGGNGPYTFDWDHIPGPDNPQNLTDLHVGNYSVTVSDVNGCTISAENLLITEDCCVDFEIASVVVVEATCNNDNGSACIDIVGNNGDYTFDWNTNDGTPNTEGNCRTGLPAGVYSVTITGDPDCPSIIETFTIGNSDFPLVTLLATTPATCLESNGTAVMSEINYEYLWLCNGATGYNPTNLPAGSCVVQITDPVSGCIDYQTVFIDTFNPLMAEVVVNNQPDCGLANGSVSITVSGGSTNYNYNWSNGNSTADADNIPAGAYCVTVTDNGPTGCETITCFVLNDNVPGAVVVVADSVSTSCTGLDNATADFDITYDPAFAQPATIEILNSNGEVVNNGELSPGNYCIVVTDANGCFAGSDCFEVIEPAQIDIDIAINNECDPTPGIGIVEISGGTPPYTFDWCDLPGNDNPQDRPDLETGTYCVTVTDANGCTAAAIDLSVVDTCACPPMIIGSVVVVESNCETSSGQATVNLVGADMMNLSYDWDPAQADQPTITDLAAGNYSVTITNLDQPSCTVTEEFSVGNTDGPEASYLSSPAFCGSADGTVTFSEPGYTYTWSNPLYGTSHIQNNVEAGTYFVTISDPANPDCIDVKTIIVDEVASFSASYTIIANPDCNTANGSVSISTDVPGDYSYSWGSDATMNDLSAGIYQVTITENTSGCTTSLSFVLTDNVPNASVNIVAEAFVSCPGSEDGLINYSITGNGNYEAQIQDANGNVQSNGSLSSGTYCIVLTENNTGCIVGGTCVEVREPPQIDVDVAVFHENCGELGSIELIEVIGGNGGFTYSWSNPISGNQDPFAYDLGAGPYSFTVTDARNCDVSETVIVLDDPNALSINTSPDTTICSGSALISVSTSAGTYEWTDSEGNILGTSSSISVDTSGTYYIAVTNADCVEMDSVEVINGTIAVEVISDTLACAGVSGQFVSVQNLNPDDLLTYVWSPDSLIVDATQGMPSVELNLEGAGQVELSVLVTNQYGCATSEIINVAVVDTLDTPETFYTTQCEGTTIDFEILGNSPQYSWDFNGDGVPDGTGNEISHTYQSTGLYEVMVIASPLADCFEPDTVFMEVLVEDVLFFPEIDVEVEECTDEGVVVLTDMSTHINSDITQWDWTTNIGVTSDSSSITLNVNESQDVDVQLIITTDSGCIDTITQTIPINLVNISLDDIEFCSGESALLNPNGNPELVYLWSPENVLSDIHAVSPTITSDEDVTISLIVTDSTGLCSDSETILVNILEGPDLMLSAESTLLCSDEMVTLTATTNATNVEWYDELGGILLSEDDTFEASPGSFGESNTLYVLSSMNGCTSIDSITISNRGLSFEIEGDNNACDGDTIFLYPQFPNEIDITGAAFNWTGDDIVEPSSIDEAMIITSDSSSGIYTLEVNNGTCDFVNSFTVNISDVGNAQATADPDTILLSESSQLDILNVNDGWTFQWSPDPSFNGGPLDIENPEVTPEETTTYWVEITDGECVDTRGVTVTVVTICEEPYIFFPNAFSPNGDGYNDVLLVRGEGITDSFFAIYNRWGEKVYESNNQNDGWDGTFNGKELPSDVYGFYLRVRCGNEEEFYKQGNVTLFR